MNALTRLLKTPSSFPRDAKGWTINQTGHAYIVGGGLALAGMPLVLILIGYAIWETVQWLRYGAEPWDCLEDTAHVMMIACATRYKLPAFFFVHAIFLLSGYLQRRSAT